MENVFNTQAKLKLKLKRAFTYYSIQRQENLDARRLIPEFLELNHPTMHCLLALFARIDRLVNLKLSEASQGECYPLMRILQISDLRRPSKSTSRTHASKRDF